MDLPWLPPTDARAAFPYALRAADYAKAMATDLRPGTQVRVQFAVRLYRIIIRKLTNHYTTVQMADDPTRCEWMEGRVYGRAPRPQDKERGWTKCPFQCLRVIWVRMDYLTVAGAKL